MDEVQNELLSKIKVAIKNPSAIQILDERRVACILYNYFIKISGAAIDDIDILMNDLPSKYSGFTKRRIHEIAYVAELLTHCQEHGLSND
ncbi:MAG: hypothetical protein WBE34_19670 [Candidatus Nitrosopolaris sp.]